MHLTYITRNVLKLNVTIIINKYLSVSLFCEPMKITKYILQYII